MNATLIVAGLVLAVTLFVLVRKRKAKAKAPTTSASGSVGRPGSANVSQNVR